jgi:hypothetical protein
MTTLHRRKRGESLDTDESSDSSEDKDSADSEPDKPKVSRSVKCLCSGDRRSSSSGSLHGQIKSRYDREYAEHATASSAFMETVQTHLKNTEDNQKKTISLLERLVDKA